MGVDSYLKMSVVVDFGSYTSKVGFATDTTPTFSERSVAASYSSAMGAANTIRFGEDGLSAASCDPEARVMPSLWSASSLVSATQATVASTSSAASREVLFQHVLHLYSRLFNTNNPTPLLGAHPLNAIIPETWFSDRRVLETLVETLLGYSYGSERAVNGPALYLSRPSVSAAVGAGRPSALVLDVGHSQTTATAVCDGYALGSSIRSVPAGGAALNNLLLNLCPVSPATGERCPHSLSSICRSLGYPQGWMPTFVDRAVSTFRVYGGTSMTVPKLGDQVKESAPVALHFELPDGNQALVPEHDVFGVYEYGLFSGSKLSSQRTATNALPSYNIANLLVDCKSRVDPQVSQLLPVVVCGGVSQTRGFAERFAKELRLVDPSITAMYNPLLPVPAGTIYNLQWSGAALISQSSAFSGMWITSGEYEELGSSLLSRKLFL